MLPGWAGREFPWENGRLPAKFSFFFLLIYLVYRHFSLFLFLAFNYCLLPLRIEGGTINGFTRFSGPVFQLPAPIVVWAGWTAFHSIANVVLHTQGRKKKEPRWLVVKTSVSVCIFAYWEASCLWEKSSSVRREKETGGVRWRKEEESTAYTHGENIYKDAASRKTGRLDIPAEIPFWLRSSRWWWRFFPPSAVLMMMALY